MRLQASSAPSDSRQYFIRSSSEERERGPFSIEHLIDLADCDQVSENTLLRPASEAEPRPLSDWPDLKAAIFPQKKAFQFKSYQRTEDPDAGLAPIDTTNLLRCELGSRPDSSSAHKNNTPAAAANSLKLSQETSPNGFDPKAALAESQEISRMRTAPSQRKRTRPPLSAGRVFLVTRWVLAAILVGFGVLLAGGVQFTFGLPFIAMGFLLIVLDLIGWAMDAFENRNSLEPLDYTAAEKHFTAGEWKQAAHAYLRVLEDYPHETRAYIAGVASATAANNPKQITAFHNLARRHLGEHDYNLITEALRRRGLPPLPAKERLV